MITQKKSFTRKEKKSLLAITNNIEYLRKKNKAESHVSHNINTVLHREPKLTLTDSFDEHKSV